MVKKSKKDINKVTVEKTVNRGLCLSCEACNAVCPKSAISMRFAKGLFLPVIKEDLCIQCGICLEVCPGINPDPHGYSKEKAPTFDKEPLSCYTAKIKDAKLLKKTASGGIASGLVKSLLEKGEYNAAFLLKYDKFNEKPARLRKVTDPERVIDYARSKYIPASIYEAINELKKNKKDKFILVGTACQFQAINNFIDKFKYPRENLLFLGLVCDRTLNFNIYDYFERKFSKKGEKIKEFNFRSKTASGWPGDTRITFSSERTVDVTRKIRMSVKDFFQLKRYAVCLSGKLNPYSDITLGDCYLQGREDTEGVSSVIVRTRRGQHIWSKFQDCTESIRESYRDIYRSQGCAEKMTTKNNMLFAMSFRSINYFYLILIPKIKTSAVRLYFLIDLIVFLERIKSSFKLISKKVIKRLIVFLIFIFDILSPTKFTKKNRSDNGNLAIFGGNLLNKGAQAMTLIAANERVVKKNKVYVFSMTDFEKRKDSIHERYDLIFAPMNRQIALRLLAPSFMNAIKGNAKIANDYLNSCTMAIDVSGFALSSQFGFKHSIDYILNIAVMRKYGLLVKVMPQSFGPFEFGFLKTRVMKFLINFYLNKVDVLYARERSSREYLGLMNVNNSLLSKDMVLLSQGNYWQNLYMGDIMDISIEEKSACIIPNSKLIKYIGEGQLLNLYKGVIDVLRKNKLKIYILRHSYEDLDLCKKIKSISRDGATLLDGDYTPFELENIIGKFDFVVASRYHSLIHAYKKGVPAIVFGWANKYVELMNDFNQGKYIFDVRSGLNSKIIFKSIETIIKNRFEESITIKEKLKEFRNG